MRRSHLRLLDVVRSHSTDEQRSAGYRLPADSPTPDNRPYRFPRTDFSRTDEHPNDWS